MLPSPVFGIEMILKPVLLMDFSVLLEIHLGLGHLQLKVSWLDTLREDLRTVRQEIGQAEWNKKIQVTNGLDAHGCIIWDNHTKKQNYWQNSDPRLGVACPLASQFLHGVYVVTDI